MNFIIEAHNSASNGCNNLRLAKDQILLEFQYVAYFHNSFLTERKGHEKIGGINQMKS